MDNLAEVPAFEEARVAMGRVRRLADRVDLAEMEPRTDAASTGYALVREAKEYLVYQPGSGDFTVALPTDRRHYAVEWIRPSDGRRWRSRLEAVGTWRPLSVKVNCDCRVRARTGYRVMSK